MKLTKAEREEIAAKRLLRIIERHGVANARTLEQKISDAGPFGQRIDPHILTPVRNRLVDQGRIVKAPKDNVPWFHLPDASPVIVAARQAEQLAIYKKLHTQKTHMRTGQALEIATYRAFLALNDAEFNGRFRDLDEHDDSTLYDKEEPPQHIGSRELPGNQRLDFLYRHPVAGYMGVECKNVREWLYPDREEVIELLRKCIFLDCVPVIIARRIPFVTFKLLSTCGVILHQTYNQLMAQSDAELAEQAKHKNMLGYHDIKTGNAPDARLIHFITINLPSIAPEAKAKFEEYKDLLEGFAFKDFGYIEFAARIRRRSEGVNEQWDEDNFPV